MVVGEGSEKVDQQKWKEVVGVLGLCRSFPLVDGGCRPKDNLTSKCSVVMGFVDAQQVKPRSELNF